MQIAIPSPRKKDSGYALMLVLVFGSIGCLILAGAMRWHASDSVQINRFNQHAVTLAAAEAAIEKVLSEITTDFQNEGPALVSSKPSIYRTRVPTAAEDPLWREFRFTNREGAPGTTLEPMSLSWNNARLISQYEGLFGYSTTFRLVSQAEELNTRNDQLVAAVQQEVQLALIPVFQFAIFYNIDLEINPGPDMTVNGRVHANGNIYTQPQATLTFLSDVTASGAIVADKKPGDPLLRTPGTVVYKEAHDGDVGQLTLPIGTNNTPTAVREIVERPPSLEDQNSPMGRQRLYNQADLILLVDDKGIIVKSGVPLQNKGINLTLADAVFTNFVNTNISFYNGREGRMVKATEINIAQLANWNSDPNNPLKAALGRDLRSLYAADLRSQSLGTEPGIRLVNGQNLPESGLTVVTPHPLYVKGNYNSAGVGITNNPNYRPAALIADAITILSANWQDATNSSTVGKAAPTSVNAAFLSGIVPTVSGDYSGGVENFPRFLENWTSVVFEYSGSMICMYESKWAKEPWDGSGRSYYSPPIRRWAFDVNFTNPTRLPPLTPSVNATIRGQWTTLAPGA